MAQRKPARAFKTQPKAASKAPAKPTKFSPSRPASSEPKTTAKAPPKPPKATPPKPKSNLSSRRTNPNRPAQMKAQAARRAAGSKQGGFDPGKFIGEQADAFARGVKKVSDAVPRIPDPAGWGDAMKRAKKNAR